MIFALYVPKGHYTPFETATRCDRSFSLMTDLTMRSWLAACEKNVFEPPGITYERIAEATLVADLRPVRPVRFSPLRTRKLTFRVRLTMYPARSTDIHSDKTLHQLYSSGRGGLQSVHHDTGGIAHRERDEGDTSGADQWSHKSENHQSDHRHHHRLLFRVCFFESLSSSSSLPSSTTQPAMVKYSHLLRYVI